MAPLMDGWTVVAGVAGRGRLKVFVGMAAGVGKTYAMLEEGHERADVAARTWSSAGWRPTVERRRPRRPRASRCVPPTEIDYRGVTLRDMDLDAVLARGRRTLRWSTSWRTPTRRGCATRSATPTSRNCSPRGSTSCSTVNVQHLESLNDRVFELTGVRVRETIPDQVLLDADDVVLVDLTPEGLQARLRAGKVYAHGARSTARCSTSSPARTWARSARSRSARWPEPSTSRCTARPHRPRTASSPGRCRRRSPSASWSSSVPSAGRSAWFADGWSDGAAARGRARRGLPRGASRRGRGAPAQAHQGARRDPGRALPRRCPTEDLAEDDRRGSSEDRGVTRLVNGRPEGARGLMARMRGRSPVQPCSSSLEDVDMLPLRRSRRSPGTRRRRLGHARVTRRVLVATDQPRQPDRRPRARRGAGRPAAARWCWPRSSWCRSRSCSTPTSRARSGRACEVWEKRRDGGPRLSPRPSTPVWSASRSFAKGVLQTFWPAEPFDLLVLERRRGASPGDGQAAQIEAILERARVTVTVVIPANSRRAVAHGDRSGDERRGNTERPPRAFAADRPILPA